MNELLAAFLASISGIKDQANAMLKGLPPLEQFEASQEISYGIRSLTRYGNELVENANNLSAKMADFVAQTEAKFKTAAAATAEAELLATGGYVKKADHEAAMSAAVNDAKAAERAAVSAELEASKAIADKRAALVAGKELPAVTAEKISDAVLGAADADAQIAAIKGRADKLIGLGIKPEEAPSIFAEVAGIPVSAEGDATFEARFASIQELRPKGAAVKPAAPINPAAGAGGGGGAEDRSRVNRLL